jgi:hypothetical protein
LSFFAKFSKLQDRIQRRRRVRDAKSKPFYLSTSEGKVETDKPHRSNKAKFLSYQSLQIASGAWISA